MIILVEGTDNTGKTTLIRKLENTLGMERTIVLHSTGPASREALVSNAKLFIEIARQANKRRFSVIFDRMQLTSEAVYGPLLRGTNHFGDEWDTLWEQFMAQNPHIVYCRPSRETIHKTLHERKQMEGVVANTNRLIDAYDKMINGLMEGYRAAGNVEAQKRFHIYNFETDPDAYDLMDALGIIPHTVYQILRGRTTR